MWRIGRSSVEAFTLLEVIVVLMILSLVGVATSLSVPNARDRIRLEQTGAWLESMLADVRVQARRHGQATWVEFDMAASRYRRSGGGWRGLPSGVTWSFDPGERRVTSRRVVMFLPDGTGAGSQILIRSGAYTSARRIERLTGVIAHVHAN